MRKSVKSDKASLDSAQIFYGCFWARGFFAVAGFKLPGSLLVAVARQSVRHVIRATPLTEDSFVLSMAKHTQTEWIS